MGVKTVFKTGDFVKFADYTAKSKYFPKVGTLGKVVKIDRVYFGRDNEFLEQSLKIQWAKGSTIEDDCWYCNSSKVVRSIDILV